MGMDSPQCKEEARKEVKPDKAPYAGRTLEEWKAMPYRDKAAASGMGMKWCTFLIAVSYLGLILGAYYLIRTVPEILANGLGGLYEATYFILGIAAYIATALIAIHLPQFTKTGCRAVF